MFVHDVGVEFAEFGPGKLKRLSAGDGPALRRVESPDVFLQHGVKLRIAINVGLLPVFVADADHLQMEGAGGFSAALRAPRAGDGAIGEFNQIDGILNESIEFFGSRLRQN